MINFILNKENNKKIDNVKFNEKLTYEKFWQGETFLIVNHEELAKIIIDKNMEVSSVIILCDMLKDELWQNPKCMHITNNICTSKIQRLARERINNKYFEKEEEEKLYEKFKLAKEYINYEVPEYFFEPTELFDKNGNKLKLGIQYFIKKENKEFTRKKYKYKSELFDELCNYKELMLYPEILEEQKEMCKYEYDEEKDKEIILSDDEWKKRWKEKKIELFKPETISDYKRVYSMPNPFDHYDSRNSFQQWFFVKFDKGICYFYGGSGSSGARESMGRYAHTFAYLEKKHNVKIPTVVTKYNDCNEFIFLKKYETFKCINRELYGNYQAERNKTKKIFNGKLLELFYKDSKYYGNINFKEIND